MVGSFLLAVSLAAPSEATDTWYDPHPGVRYLHRTDGTPWQIHALEVDLCARGVAARATTESERQRTTSSFGGLVGAQAAINGDFFSYDGYWPTGLGLGAGEHWHADNTWEGFLALGRDHALITEPTEQWDSLADWMSEAVGGYPVLVRDGSAKSSFSPAPSHCSDRHPRTAVGLSEDRQTLILVVVDGRSTASSGMTCAELSSLLAGLGAWTALNLDGGGSSAAWTEAYGVLNDPSDGSERTVANHLAVWASGSGAPESCDFWLDELVVGAHLLDAPASTDLDGDGQADVCARAGAGLWCYRSTGAGFPARWEIQALSSDAGFSAEDQFATLRFGDVTGDGQADVCARSGEGLRCWPGGYGGFGEPIEGPELSDAGGWGAMEYWSTLRLADVTGDGLDDLCARAAAGLLCYPSTGTGFSDPLELGDMGDAQGWTEPWYYGTLRSGDLDGDGLHDLCARGAVGIYCWRSEGDGFSESFSGPVWSDAEGWDDVRHWSTIRMADLDGDGLADLCGRSPDDFRCHLSTGSGFGDAVVGPALSDAQGWWDHSNYATLALADTDGDGDLDLCARANAGVFCWPWEGAGFGDSVEGPALSDDEGWDDHRYYSTLRWADIDGDGAADLCARSAAGLGCWLGPGLSEQVEGPEWSDALGWDGLSHYSTLRLAGGAVAEASDSEPEDSSAGAPALRHPEEGCQGCATGRSRGGWACLLLVAWAHRGRRGVCPPERRGLRGMCS